MDEHEVYANPPIVLVAVEIRHPTADVLTPSENRALKHLLSTRVPIERPGQVMAVQFSSGLTAPSAAVTERFPRYMNRDLTLAVSIRKEAVTVEATRYEGWQEFKDVVMQVLDARMKIAPIAGVERVGVRYINEIRPPREPDSTWNPWVQPSLLGPEPTSANDLPLSQWQGLAVYGSQPGRMMIFRYGPRQGFAIDPASDLRQNKRSDAGEYFLMDIDSFWTPEDSLPEYDREKLSGTFDDLHAPAKMLFEEMITDRLREEVFQGSA